MTMSLLYSYNNTHHKFKDLHDETGGKLAELSFKYYDCFCGGKEYKIIANATRHRNHFDVVQCQACGTLRINPYLTDASIEQYYKEIYGPVKRKNIAPDVLYKRQMGTADEVYSYLAPLLAKGSKILDYGSGAGGRMEKLKEAGYDVYLHDFDKNYLDYGLSKGMKAHQEGTRYDAVILRDVLEHINQPVEFLKQAQSWLNEKGIIFIEVPFMENNRTLLADFHLAHKFYFSCESITHLAHIAGYKKIKDYRNAIVITKGVPDKPISLEGALAGSNLTIAKSRKKEMIGKLKSTFKKVK
jgi:2-polyprenyl-3-methyl-5-hydroxy-6-metoxy-1,4-benzoquinol methylase